MEIVKRIKILFLVTQSEMGGAQRYIYEIGRALDKEKYEVLVAAGEPAFVPLSGTTTGKGDCDFFEKLKMAGVKPLKLKQLKRAPWPWQISSAIWEIRGLLKKEKPDILFLCSTTAGLLGSIASKIYKLKTKNYQLKTVYRIGGWAFRDPRSRWKNWLVLLAEKLTAPLKDLIIVNSEIDRKLALQHKIVPENKLVKICNGIDADSLNFLSREEARLRLRLNQSNEEKIVGTVANFYKTKGLEYFIESAHILIEASPRSIPPQAIFVIIGEGRLRPKLEELIKKYGLENKVVLAGRIPDAYRYLKAFDVFVLPSLKEGFPWIILEARAAGIPIVATSVGAIPEILNEESLATPGDAEVLAKKIGWALQRPAKNELKPEFTSQRMLEETLQALQKLLPPTA